MSDELQQQADEANAGLKLYLCEMTFTCTAWVEVEANDDDEAHDFARADWREQVNPGDLEVDIVQVESVRESAA